MFISSSSFGFPPLGYTAKNPFRKDKRFVYISGTVKRTDNDDMIMLKLKYLLCNEIKV